MISASGLFAGFFLPLLALGITSYVLGRRIAWRLPFAGRLERGVVSTALGLSLIAHILFLLGLAGLLRPLPVLLLAAGVHAVGIPAWRELGNDLRLASARPWWIWLLAAAGLAPLVLLALYPPTAFDATLYHLPFARAFVRSGGVPFLADLRFPVFPQANEILYAAVMMFGRDVAAQGVQLLATLLTALLLVLWGRWGWLAAAIFLGNPIVIHLAATGYVEPGLTLFVVAAFFALDRWRGGGGKGWLMLSALFAATAADVKYLGLFFMGVAGLTVLLAGGRTRSLMARLREAVLFTAVALAVMAPWYLRIVLHTGNPLFPFLSNMFGESLWQVSALPETVEALPARLLRWVRLPWDVVFERQRYNQQPPLSPIYLAALPLLVFGFARDRRIRYLLLIPGVYALVFTWLPSDSRYLMPALPLASLAVAGAVAETARRWPSLGSRRLAAALCVGCVLPGWLYAGYRIARQGPLPVTMAGRESYLANRLPVYPAIAFLNRQQGSAYTLWAFHAENMAYFAHGRFLGDWFGPASYSRMLTGARDAEALHRELRRLGATHLLVTDRTATGHPFPLPIPEDEAFRRWFHLVYRDSAARIYRLPSLPARATSPQPLS
jgi:hypothetical protein